MKKSHAFLVASGAVGIACALLLLWVWRQDRALQAVMSTAPAPIMKPTVAASSAPVALPPPTARRAPLNALIAALDRALAARDARPHEATLTFKDEAALQRFAARAHAAGLTIIGRLDRLRAARVGFDDVDALRRDLAENADDYTEAGANNLVTVPTAPSKEQRAMLDQVPFGNDTLAFLGAGGDRTTWGRGQLIAILDTGVGADATFGAGRVTPLDIGLGIGPENSDAQEGGHGTAVAGLAAGASKDAAGVAPAANLLSIRVTDASGVSDLFTLSHAIVAAVDAGAKIINVSMGGYSTGGLLDAAITYATQQGAVIVAAAGNDQAAQLAWPAADPRVVSVGAVDRAEQQVVFSNSGAQLQLSAPGYGVQTAWLDGQRVYVDGTSASAPLVSGAIAALMSQNPNLTPQQAVALLVATANDTGAPGADPAFGHGIVNLATAMNRSNPAYVDTAVASHYYDAENNQMLFTVQNRSGRTVSGMSLAVTAGTTTTMSSVPSLAAGETYVAKIPVNDATLIQAGTLRFTTELTNPLGVTDQVPANNKRSSVLTAPGKP